ncbi:hypothetical protein AMAG_03704 [Allomyces macrogynus ATCC 38327]|uniref:t-SNARE coiled-coil homology domain-containing protein n=1 Tax=Allomyces macrogynus (strain ATCC 38327) TaxID=578462 RepID=A0A0L0SAB7_ALLM3|nr:hypothetical protein AMAG_03704 [Allomyces macrogynus ATCC 38327]|eukprot:KNE59426.1 hypothetical protein AMAG_03704 [Allomyces macrogynus ATCC 38327]
MDITREFWKCASEASPGGTAKNRLDILPPIVRRHSAAGLRANDAVRAAAAVAAAASSLSSGTAVSSNNAATDATEPSDPFLVEATGIATDLADLAKLIHQARRGYLGLGSAALAIPSDPFGPVERSPAKAVTMTVMGFSMALPAKMTHAEREALDTQCALLLGRSRDNIRRMEATLSRERKEHEAAKVATKGGLRAFLGFTRSTVPSTAVNSADLLDPTSSTISTLPSLGAHTVQELERENRALLEQYASKLDEIKAAEQSLLTIAQLQADIAQHLATQQTAIETLFEEAAQQTDQVREGNAQLVQAREAAKGARLWFLVMVLVLSFTLLFLDWYAG